MSYKIEYPIWIHGNYRQWHLDYTVSSVRFLKPHEMPVFIVNLEQYLETSQADYVIVQSPGHCIDTRLFESRFLKSDLKDNLIVGHILLDGDNSPWLHPQCFIINIKLWNELGQPFFGKTQSNEQYYPNFISSKDMFHDDYTPTYIKFDHSYRYKTCDKFGWNIIRHQLLHSGFVYAFPSMMRSCKNNIYTHNELAHDLSYSHLRDHYETVKNNQVYIFSNDYIPTYGNINHIITQSSGFKCIKHIKNNNPSKLTIYDCSEKSLNWQKKLREEWNGVDFIDFYMNNYIHTPNERIFPKSEIFPYENEWKKVVDFFEDDETFLLCWNRYLNMDVDFKHVDVLKYNRSNLFQNIKENETLLFDLSNIFFMPINIFGRTFDCIIKHIEDIKKNVYKKTNNVIFFGLDCYGRDI